MLKFNSLSLAFATLVVTAGMASAAPPTSDHVHLAPAVGAVTLRATDGVKIHGLFYPAIAPKALILLFHQAGSSKGEYATIAPRLTKEGYSALAIDQRSGGGLFGRNETAAALKGPTSYLDAKQDLEAALAWAQQHGLPVILWGSSYSAALVFLVAAEHSQSLRGVLAFSPGEYLGNPTLVRNAAARVQVPVFVTSAETAEEIGTARAILAAVPTALKIQYVPTQGGIHGSSTLIPSRNRRGVAANWQAVLDFLSRLL